MTPIDEVAVARAAHGDPVRLTRAERAEAVRRLTNHGRSAAQIAGLLRITPRSVVRNRAKLRHATQEVAA